MPERVAVTEYSAAKTQTVAQTIVVKVGTSSLTNPETGNLSLSTIATLVEVLSDLRRSGHRVVLVSSGAIGVGCARLGMTERPKTIAVKQAVAAVGQGRLIRVYDYLFTEMKQPIAQVLLTRGDLVERSRYVNVYRTFHELLNLNVIPIVNENDTVAVDELKFGDNDTLSALVASLVDADWLFLMTDVDRLYTANPRTNPDAKPIDVVRNLDELNVDTATGGTQWGTGGMETKIAAARIAMGAGVRTVIMKSDAPGNVLKILAGESIGTRFEPQENPITARQRWIAHGMVPAGKLYLDDGAVEAVRNGGRSLLGAGLIGLDGEFQREDTVRLCNIHGQEIARGLVNYSHTELQKIRGRRSDEISQILGYDGEETVVHRDNLVLMRKALR
jgi:glutamate 5-kinase